VIRYARAVTYRDEKGALQAKVGELEGELQEAQRKIAQLTGAAPAPSTGDGETLGAPSGLGVPTSLRIEKVVDGELTMQGYEAIASVIRDRLGLETTQVGARMETLHRPRQPAGRIQIAVKDGKTHIVLERDWSDRAPGTWVFAGMLGMFGGFITAALMHDLFHLGDAMAFANVLWAGPLVGGLASIPIRRVARSQIEAELAARRGAFAAIVEVAEKHRAPAVRARVEVADAAEPEADAVPSAALTERGGSR
jgi:hypothetical protein